MKLEKEIHQKKFKSERQKAMINILFTAGWLSERIKQHLKPFELSLPQYNVLRILNGQYPNPISTSVIRERMLDKMSDTSRIVSRLCQKGLVARGVCSKDKRLVDVIISEKGQKLIQNIDKHYHELENIMEGVNELESQLLNSLLDKIRT